MTKLTIYNQGDTSSTRQRLSKVVSLLNQQGSIIKSYGIGDASPCSFIDVSVGKASTAGYPSRLLVRRVKVQLDGTNYLRSSSVCLFNVNQVPFFAKSRTGSLPCIYGSKW